MVFFNIKKLAYIKIIDYILINKGYASYKKVDKIFVSKSNFELLYIYFCIEIKYCLIFF